MNIINKKYTVAILILLTVTAFAKTPFWEHKDEMGIETAIIRDIKLLETNNHCVANIAYRRLVRHGKKAIPFLIANAYNTNIFVSFVCCYLYSSNISFGRSSGFISLYLIETILHDNETPHWGVGLNSPDKPSIFCSGEALTNAVNAYTQWWEKNKDKSLDEIRKTAINPLASSKWYWTGYLKALRSIKSAYPTNWRASVRWHGKPLGSSWFGGKW